MEIMTRDYQSPEQAVWQCLYELCPAVHSSVLKSGRLQIVVELQPAELDSLREKLRERLGDQTIRRVMR